MRSAHRLYHLARADFYERVRRHGFLVALLFCVYAGYAFLPPMQSRYVTLVMDDHRGIYNSAWIGTAVAMLSGAFISLIGFFIVKNAVERDRRTGVGQILATTPISRLQYTIGKTLSNFAVLASMTLIVAIACAAMQFIRGEDRSFDAWRMFSPFVLLTLPVLMVTSATAVFFETMPVLRGGMGNVAFIFVWGATLGSFGQDMAAVHNDPLGTGIVVPGMFETCHAAFPAFDPHHASLNMGINIRGKGEWTLSTFTWHGIDWTLQHVMWRLGWVAVGLAIAGIAAIPFDRFDPARSGVRRASKKSMWRMGGASRTTRSSASSRDTSSGMAASEPAADCSPASVREASPESLSPLAPGAHRARLGAMVWAEWKLIMRGLRWWYIGPLGLTIAACVAPLSGVRAIVLPIAWFWPVLQWSKLGTREAVNNTEPVFFSAPHPLSRQLAATWLAGVMLSVMAGFAVALRFVIAGESHALLAWCVGAAFIPALALALGVWTRTGKAFEALYTALCYAVIQQAAPLDFMGAVTNGPRSNPAVFGSLTLILLALSVLGRRQRLQT